MLSAILAVKKLLLPFTKKNWKKQIKIKNKELRVEKVIKRKGARLEKWKGYDNSFDSLIGKKDIVM